jgi:hypothetical protein
MVGIVLYVGRERPPDRFGERGVELDPESPTALRRRGSRLDSSPGLVNVADRRYAHPNQGWPFAAAPRVGGSLRLVARRSYVRVENYGAASDEAPSRGVNWPPSCDDMSVRLFPAAE